MGSFHVPLFHVGVHIFVDCCFVCRRHMLVNNRISMHCRLSAYNVDLLLNG